jgi:histidinol dehydrogenase
MIITTLNCNNRQELLARDFSFDAALLKKVQEIVLQVASKGDQALIDFTKRFDGAVLSPNNLLVGKSEIEQAVSKVDSKFKQALRLAYQRIRNYHQRQLKSSWYINDSFGMFGQKISPINKVGLYVPGGKANYPSSVLMNAIPAQVAGVEEVIVCTPSSEEGKVGAEVLYACQLLGIDRVFKVGGAQAIAAMAYGTETIPKVDKIVGPGNIYVTLAKKFVVGRVDIDMLAGPSEVLVLADSSANPRFIAADLLAQAEHDEQAIAILVTDSHQLAEEVSKEIEAQLELLERKEIASKSIASNAKIVVCPTFLEAVDFANDYAPEHLEIMAKNPLALLQKISNAGAIFLGSYSAEVFGDYLAGPNHVLPTGGTARFYSPLGVSDFLKSSSVIYLTKEGARELSTAVAAIAEVENLGGHRRAALLRNKNDSTQKPND